MSLDIRLPIGGMFLLVGVLLAIYGLATNGSDMYARSLGINVNLWWGLVMVVFGGVMFLFGLRKRGGKPGSACLRAAEWCAASPYGLVAIMCRATVTGGRRQIAGLHTPRPVQSPKVAISWLHVGPGGPGGDANYAPGQALPILGVGKFGTPLTPPLGVNDPTPSIGKACPGA